MPSPFARALAAADVVLDGQMGETVQVSPQKLGDFARLPRAAWIRPDLPVNPQSSVHELDREPNITLLPEDLFNELETPERFHDQVHMNQGGLDRFTETLARKMREVLEPISDAL